MDKPMTVRVRQVEWWPVEIISHNRITIPRPIRKNLNIQQGQVIHIRVQEYEEAK